MNCLKCKKTIEREDFYGLHKGCFKVWFDLPDLLSFTQLDPKQSSNSAKIEKLKDSFYHGKYLKYSVRLNSIHYILKLQEEKFPELPSTEYLCNQIADMLGIKVPEYYLIRFKKKSETKNSENKKDLLAFVTKNFMQRIVGSLHHIYKFLPKGDSHYNCENIIHIIKKECARTSDIKNFVEICLFDSLIGNNDRHGRNLGIIETKRGKRLAPMYDNPSYLSIESNNLLSAHFDTSGSIWTLKSKEPKPSDYIEEFKRLKFNKYVSEFIEKTINNFTQIKQAIEESEISKLRKKAIAKLINERFEVYKKAIEKGI